MKVSSLIKDNFYKELFSFALPIGLQNLLMALVGATDSFMLGRFSQDAVSAVSLSGQLGMIMSLFTGAVISGGGVLLAQYFGKGDFAMVKNIFCMIIKWLFAISFLFFAVAMLVPETLMRIYTSDPKLIKIGASYLRCVSVSYLFYGITSCYYMLMKLEGRATKSVIISIVTLVTDVVLDLFLIYGIAGFPRLGANGSAISTVFVSIISLTWCIAVSHKGGSIRPDIKGFMWKSFDITKVLLKIAVPMLGGSLAWGLGETLHSFIMGHLGSDATAAASITGVAQSLTTCFCGGISVGAGIMIGQRLGQSLFEEAKECGRKFWHISFWIGGLQMLIMWMIAPLVLKFFVLTEAAKSYLIIMLIFRGIYCLAYSLNAIIVCGIFPAGGDSKYNAISALIASWCFALPLALLGAFVFEWPVVVVYIVMCADEIVKTPWIYPRYKKYLWVKNLTRTQKNFN